MEMVYRFPNAKDATSYVCPESVSEIGNYAFAWCTGVKKITIPEDIFWVDSKAFYCCPNLSSVTIKCSNCIFDDLINGTNVETICNSYDSISDEYSYLGVIYGYDNSTAQEYANYFERTFISLGADPRYTTTTTSTTTTTTTTTRKTTTTTTTTRRTTTTSKINTTKQTITTTTASYISDKPGPAVGDLSYFDKYYIDNATVKPILSLSQIELSIEEAKTNPVCTVNLSVKDAEKKYCATGIHIYWDKILSFNGDE